jgi:hypothetical protein
MFQNLAFSRAVPRIGSEEEQFEEGEEEGSEVCPNQRPPQSLVRPLRDFS